MVSRFIRRIYAPFLLKREVKGAVVIGFAGLFIAAAMGVQNIDLGLGSFFIRFSSDLSQPESSLTHFKFDPI